MVGNARWSDEEIRILKEMYYDHSNDEIAEVLEDRTVSAIQHKGPRLGLEKSETAIVERRSNEYNVPNTDTTFAGFISGLTAGEGSFVIKDDTQFVFQIDMADREEEMIRDVMQYLGVGNINFYDRRKHDWEDIITYRVSDRSEILGVIIPFFDSVGLSDSYKSKQYEQWKKDFNEELDRKT